MPGVRATMHVVEIFLPLTRNDGTPQPRELFAKLRSELVNRFGGMTAYSRSPAEGLWESEDGAVERDAMVIFEVVADDLDRGWWSALRTRLEREFAQEEVLIRAAAAERL